MNLRLCPMTWLACLRVLPWRWAARDGLRTHPGTPWSQTLFWWRHIRNSYSPHRYWAIREGKRLVGMVGLVNGNEISLVTHPKMRGRGIGRIAVSVVVDLSPSETWGEVYAHNDAWRFWRRLVEERGGKWWEVRALRNGRRVPAYQFTLPKRTLTCTPSSLLN